jgi:uncharacterized protein
MHGRAAADVERGPVAPGYPRRSTCTSPARLLSRGPAIAAFARGDLGALQDQFFAADIVWHIAGTGPLAGDYQGAAQVMELLAKVSELSGGTVRTELRDVSDDRTVVFTAIRAERAGKQLQLNLVHVIHAENDKATEVWTQSSDPAAAAEFWS